MSITRLHPVTLPKPDVSDHDRIMGALNQAIEDQKKDEAAGQSAKGIAILWFRQNDDGTFEDYWIIQGLNALESIGLMQLCSADIAAHGVAPGNKHEDEPA